MFYNKCKDCKVILDKWNFKWTNLIKNFAILQKLSQNNNNTEIVPESYLKILRNCWNIYLLS